MSAFEPFNRRKACRYGEMLYNVHDIYIGRSLDLYGEYSEGEVDLFRRIVRPDQAVVEVGANIGAHTLSLARQVGPSGLVLAFEPQRIVLQTLCANLALNSVTNVDARQQAVGAAAGEIIVPRLDYRRDANFGGLALGKYARGERVSVIALDDLGLERCDFLKIDVEGMEEEVIEGANETLGRLKPLLYVENDRREKSAALIRRLDGLGYALYWHLPPLFNPRNFLANPQNVFDRIVSCNMLGLHRSAPHAFAGLEPVQIPALGPRNGS